MIAVFPWRGVIFVTMASIATISVICLIQQSRRWYNAGQRRKGMVGMIVSGYLCGAILDCIYKVMVSG